MKKDNTAFTAWRTKTLGVTTDRQWSYTAAFTFVLITFIELQS
jgi:hypothetical protein